MAPFRETNRVVTWAAEAMRRMWTQLKRSCMLINSRVTASEACGGPNRLSVYTSNPGDVVALPVPVIKDTDLPGQWKSAGCLQSVIFIDFLFTGADSRCSFHREPGAQRVFPYQIIMQTNLTVEACLNQCAAFGYPAAGMEFSDECCKLFHQFRSISH